MWARPAERLAAAQAAAGGRAWLSRFDHAPSLPPFDVLGPAHGADNACLWADPPCFLERPLLQRPGGAMSDADVAVSRLLQDAVLGVVAGGTPAAGALAPWPPYGVADRWTAVLDAVPRVLRDPGADRWRAWEEG
jgi:para-nitrobenzyl esterase